MKTEPTVLKGKEWHDHLTEHDLGSKKQMDLYCCTHKWTAIYEIGGYFFCMGIKRGYKNLTSLKRLVG